MDTDRNLLFGVLALQADVITGSQFIEACTLWANRKAVPLSELLAERGWLSPGDRADVERLVERKLKKHSGDARASLAEMMGDQLRQSVAEVADPEVRQTLAGLDIHEGHTLLSTIAYQPQTRERYTLSRLHARGGIGQVWLARDGDLGRDVALKEVKPERAANSAVQARFLEEAKITGQLEHPGIVPIYELARRSGDGQPFYTMRFIKGPTLQDSIRAYHAKRTAGQAGRLDLRELLTAFVSVCNAVAYAHSRGVIHRDLKSANVVLGKYGEVMVLDWGLAKVLDGSANEEAKPTQVAPSLLPVELEKESSRDETKEGNVLGTPAYIPPEQAAGQLHRIDRRSDVYGLGAILYEILTGEPPYTGPDTFGILMRVLEEPVVPPRQRVATTPAALEAICLKALAKNPAGRYGSARELAQEVQQWLADEPVQAYPEPWTVRTRRWLGRHRTLTATVAATVLVALISLGVATFLLKAAKDREQQARSLAEENFVLARAAKDREEQARTEAEENFSLARDAVNKYFTKVSESSSLKAHGLEKLRRELLEQAKEFYERFIAERAGSASLRDDLGQAHMRLAAINSALGSHSQAQKLYASAIALFEQLLRDHPGTPEYQQKLAECYAQKGLLYKWTGRLSQPEPDLLQAVNIADKLTREHPGVPEYQRLLATSQYNLAGYYSDSRRFSESEPMFQKAVSNLEALSREQPKNPEYQSDLAGSYHGLAELYRRQGEGGSSSPDVFAKAEKTFKQAVAVYEGLVRQQADVPGHQISFSNSLHNLAWVYFQTNRPGESETFHQKALAIREKVVREHPHVPEFVLYLAGSLDSLAELYISTKQLDKSEAMVRRAIEMKEQLTRDFPDAMTYVGTLGGHYVRLGKLQLERDQFPAAAGTFEKAIQTYQRVLSREPGDGRARQRLFNTRALRAMAPARHGDHVGASREVSLVTEPSLDMYAAYTLGCAHTYIVAAAGRDKALSEAERNTLTQQHAARAVQLLGQAVAKGLSQPFTGAIKEDKDFDHLRGRDDFKKLLHKLEGKTKPNAK